MAKQRRRKGKDISRTAAIIGLAVALALTVLLGYLGFNGAKLFSPYKLLPWLPTADTDNWPEALTLGLDLRGGVYIEYDATPPEGSEADMDSLMESTMKVIRSRLDSAGRTEATVQKINDNTGFRVEVPDVSDSEAIVDLIGRTAQLSFRDADGETFMTGAQVSSASASYDMTNGQGYYISLGLNSEGAQLFGDVTARSIGQTVSIYLDDDMLMSPTVNEAIYGGQVMITGGFSQSDAEYYAAQIQSGALPMTLTESNHATVSATLGDNALSTAVTAAFFGILAIMAFMIARYRLNGFVASWALCVYIILLFLLLAAFDGIQLTLPGLAGVVLGIGMAVDANVIIYERFNEEIRAGRTAKNAVRAAFRNAKSAILDANVTTLIAGLVLLISGTGSVKGFATTLLLGVLVSMFTALVITRFLMIRVAAAGADNPRLYCSLKADSGDTEKEAQ